MFWRGGAGAEQKLQAPGFDACRGEVSSQSFRVLLSLVTPHPRCKYPDGGVVPHQAKAPSLPLDLTKSTHLLRAWV